MIGDHTKMAVIALVNIDAGRLVGVKGGGSRYYGVTEEGRARV